MGDSYHSDVLGGTGFGWRVAWYRGDADRPLDGVTTFQSWNELAIGLVGTNGTGTT